MTKLQTYARKIILTNLYILIIYIMVNFSKIIGFDWDKGNQTKNFEKHNVSSPEAEQVFFNEPILVLQSARMQLSETRFYAFGRTDNGRYLHLTFTLRRNDTLIRIISARDMHKKERILYEQT